MTGTSPPAAEPADAAPETAGRAPEPAGHGPASWAHRLQRLAVGLLLLGAAGVLAWIILLVLIGSAGDGDAVGGALLVVGTALLLSALPVVPLLLAALLVRLVQGRREETAARRRREHWLTLLVVGLVGAISLCGLDVITVVAGLLDPERAEAEGEPLLVALLTLPVLLLLVILAAIGALRWCGGRREASVTLDPTVP